MHNDSFVLPNGLRVLIVDTRSFPSFTALLLVGVGSRYETPSENGLAHFLEHMVFKGSRNYPNSFILSSTIESFGGEFNAFTSKDHTGYWIKAPSAHFYSAIDVLSDMVQYPTLDKVEFEKEKGVIIEEIHMYNDQPQQKVGEIYDELLYKGNPLEFEIAGTEESIKALKQSDIKHYHDSYYTPKTRYSLLREELNRYMTSITRLNPTF